MHSAVARKTKAVLVEQSIWKTARGAKPSFPLTGGYLKAIALADPDLARAVEVEIVSFAGHETAQEMTARLLAGGAPDLIGFSVLGWNIGRFGEVAAEFRRRQPQGWTVWGGNHVSGQAARLLPAKRQVDVVVNGEGEGAWPALLRALLAGTPRTQLAGVPGISYRDEAGGVVSTAMPPRIEDLDSIPSPFLSGAVALTDARHEQFYDFILMETNRGCPYACSFCYWGGAIGQKVRRFSPARLEAEIDVIARSGAARLMLCDANFGMLPQDEQFIEFCIKARERYGSLQYFFTSWAKNKGKVFHRVVHRMKDAGMGTSFNMALQSLSEPVLEAMGRKNMALNDWQPLADELLRAGFDLYAELIWGCPGETEASFLEGYDRLAESITQIAIYPLLIMPNTEYEARREELGIVTRDSPEHDFKLVVAHNTMTIDDNRRVHRFLFWARVFGEHLYFRYLWKPARLLAGLSQSALLLSFDRWLDGDGDGIARALAALRQQVVARLETDEELIEAALQILYGAPQTDALLRRWWHEVVAPGVPAACRGVLEDFLELDLATRPILCAAAQHDGAAQTRRRRFDNDVAALWPQLGAGCAVPLDSGPAVYDIEFADGFTADMRLFHNAQNKRYFGRVTQRRAEDR